VGVLHQEGQDALLSPAPLGYVVLLDQGIIAMEGDRVKVQIEGMTAWQTELAHGIEPVAHQLRVADRVDPATVFGQERSLGDDVQSGEEGNPSSRTPLMTWRWRAVPNSFKARSDRRAQPGGIISDPGNPAAWRMRSRGIEARMGRKRNRPPNWVSNERGLRSSCRTSATSAVVGREPGGRSSSARRGKRANPSSLRIWATVTGLRGSPWWARLRLMS